MQITLVVADITDQVVDAVVNAANSSLLGGGGVDGAIHRRGGPQILEECRALRAGHLGGGLPRQARLSRRLLAISRRDGSFTRSGPVYSRTDDRSHLLASCYRESLRVADELEAKTVAFPAVSAGVYGWPADDAARIAVSTVQATATDVDEVRFVLFSEAMYDQFAKALGGVIDPAKVPSIMFRGSPESGTMTRCGDM